MEAMREVGGARGDGDTQGKDMGATDEAASGCRWHGHPQAWVEGVPDERVAAKFSARRAGFAHDGRAKQCGVPVCSSWGVMNEEKSQQESPRSVQPVPVSGSRPRASPSPLRGTTRAPAPSLLSEAARSGTSELGDRELAWSGVVACAQPEGPGVLAGGPGLVP